MSLAESAHNKNHLLAALPADDYNDDYKALTQHAAVIPLEYSKQLYLQDAPIDYVYFPLNCVVSMLVGVNDGAKVEMATVGNEGMVGFSTILDERRSIGDNVVQVPGMPFDSTQRFSARKARRGRRFEG
jgi:hypothetical protein